MKQTMKKEDMAKKAGKAKMPPMKQLAKNSGTVKKAPAKMKKC